MRDSRTLNTAARVVSSGELLHGDLRRRVQTILSRKLEQVDFIQHMLSVDSARRIDKQDI